MKVRCLSDYLTEQQRAALGRRPYQGYLEWGVTIGEEYLVLGLTFEFDLEHATTGPYVYLLLQKGEVLNVRRYDLSLFTITDPRASRYWEVRTREFDGRLSRFCQQLWLTDYIHIWMLSWTARVRMTLGSHSSTRRRLGASAARLRPND